MKLVRLDEDMSLKELVDEIEKYGTYDTYKPAAREWHVSNKRGEELVRYNR